MMFKKHGNIGSKIIWSVSLLGFYHTINAHMSSDVAIVRFYRETRKRVPKTLIVETNNWANAGFFACFRGVIGSLNFYEKYKVQHQYQEFKVNFIDGLYRDKQRGTNWWEYYFEPIVTEEQQKTDHAPRRILKIPMNLIGQFACEAGSTITREQAYALIKKYIRIKPHIQQRVDSFVQEHFKDYFIIGIHYRGTDKIAEAPRVTYDEVYQSLREVITNLNTDRFKIFVATDEQTFIDDITQKFASVICTNCLRSTNNQAIHFQLINDVYRPSSNPYQQGEDALIDCLLLSQCTTLIRCQSNLSSAASDFNPTMPIITLNTCSWGSR